MSTPPTVCPCVRPSVCIKNAVVEVELIMFFYAPGRKVFREGVFLLRCERWTVFVASRIFSGSVWHGPLLLRPLFSRALVLLVRPLKKSVLSWAYKTMIGSFTLRAVLCCSDQQKPFSPKFLQFFFCIVCASPFSVWEQQGTQKKVIIAVYDLEKSREIKRTIDFMI